MKKPSSVQFKTSISHGRQTSPNDASEFALWKGRGGLFLSSSDSSRVGGGGQRGRVSRGKATGVFLTSGCSLKAPPSYQCPVLWSSSIGWGKGVRWWVWGETPWISVHTGWRAVLSSWPPTAHRSCFSTEDSPYGSGLMLESSDQLSECLVLRFYS